MRGTKPEPVRTVSAPVCPFPQVDRRKQIAYDAMAKDPEKRSPLGIANKDQVGAPRPRTGILRRQRIACGPLLSRFTCSLATRKRSINPAGAQPICSNFCLP